MYLSREIFSRQTIKDRLMQSAAKSWGFEKYELEQFDPLVEIMMGALAKELEKTGQYFEERYSDVLQSTVKRLIPEINTYVRPAFSFIQIPAPDNFKVIEPENTFFNKEIRTKSDVESISFTPLKAYELAPYHVTHLAYGGNVFEINNFEKKSVFRYASKKNSIFIGLKIDTYFAHKREIDLYIDWPNNPAANEYRKLLQMAEWQKVELESNRFSAFSEIENTDKAKSYDRDFSFYLQGTLMDYESSFREMLVRVKLPTKTEFHTNIFPEKLSDEENSKLEAIHKNHNVFWIECKLPVHPAINKFCADIYCQTNCIPVVNYNNVRYSTKIKQPFKIVKLQGEAFFVKIRKITNLDGEVYTPKEMPLRKKELSSSYTYQIHRNIAQLGENDAKKEINFFLDLIKEERNAFAAMEPDWLVSELKEMRILINKIEKKIEHKKQIKPTDVYIELENDKDEDIVYLDYVTCQGKKANGIPMGDLLETHSSIISSRPAMLLKTSLGGSDYIDGEIATDKLAGIIHGTDRIVTESDLILFVKNVLEEYEVTVVEVKREFSTSKNRKQGIRSNIKVEATIQKYPDNIDVSYLEGLLDNWIASRCTWGLDIRSKIVMI
jgi:hypothetical protein